jgi:2-polyprenyl-3-methyl-5-hydroxy-6-metoxy-1,4-benzoquinol methylase
MEPAVRDFFDDVYRRYTRYWREPDKPYSIDPDDYDGSVLTRALLTRLRKGSAGRALDIGAGEGGDAIRLASLGYEVDAIEGSEVGAQKVEDFARDAHASVHVFNIAAEDWVPSGKYDVIVCHGVLHYVNDKHALLSKIQAATAPQGVNSISAFSTFSPTPKCHRIIPVHPDDEDGVIASFYGSWDTQLWTPRGRPEHSHPGFEAHSHSFVKVLSSNPQEL